MCKICDHKLVLTSQGDKRREDVTMPSSTKFASSKQKSMIEDEEEVHFMGMI